MTAKAKFIQMLSTISSKEINFGSGGIRLYGREEIKNGQIGYAVSLDGKSLCRDRGHSWNPNWLVIGHETGSGEPLIMDTEASNFPVFKDFNGQGSWSPVKIAISLNVFVVST